METTHSKTRRAKGSAPKIVVPSWDSVWDSLNEDRGKSTIESMNEDGWKTVTQAAASTGLSRPRVNHMAHEGKLDWIKKRVYSGGKTREMMFVRPKV
jgi:hypothetical protein